MAGCLPPVTRQDKMKRSLSIVLSPERDDYRKVAQKWYGLSEEQMKDMDVHHNPPRHEGGRNIPEHLYIYHFTLHAAVHGNSFVTWARKGELKSHEEKNSEGKSVNAVKGANKIHEIKNESGQSVQGVKNGKKLHSDKTKDGKSVNAAKGGIASTSQLWVSTRDGFRSHAAAVSRHNKSKGWSPDDRKRIR